MSGDKIKWKCPFDDKIIKDIYPDYQEQRFISFLEHPHINYSLGCMFGSFIGDSLGSYLEFAPAINEDLVDDAMKMKGGGTFDLRAGQVTDDSEMSFHMLKALSGFDPHKKLSEQRLDLVIDIAREYLRWTESKPFDMGITCRNGLAVVESCIDLLKKDPSKKESTMKQVFENVMDINGKSESNGSLMRITPMAFFGTIFSLYPDKQLKQNQEELQQLARDQIRLVHPNEKLVSCSLHWLKALLMLSSRTTNQNFKKISSKILKQGRTRLEDWMVEVESEEPMNASIHMGWAKIAWSYGLRELQQIDKQLQNNPHYQLDQFLYIKVIEKILKRGGDTDTNAAIVGGLIGAIVGFKNLPQQYLRKMMSLDFSKAEQKKKPHDRPQQYEPRRIFVIIYQWLQNLHKYNKQFQHAPKC